MLYDLNKVQIITPGPCIDLILCHNLFKFKSKLKPKHPIQSQTQAPLQALKSLCTSTANSFHESQALSYSCLHAISNPNTNPGPISKPTIPSTPRFLFQPIFYLPCICSCSPIPLWLSILCIYLHTA